MKDSQFKRFIRQELQREAEEDLARVQADETLRNLKMPEDKKQEIWESLLREIEKREREKENQ